VHSVSVSCASDICIPSFTQVNAVYSYQRHAKLTTAGTAPQQDIQLSNVLRAYSPRSSPSAISQRDLWDSLIPNITSVIVLPNSLSCQMNIARKYKEFSYSDLHLQAFANRIHAENQDSPDRRKFDIYCLCRFRLCNYLPHLEEICPTYCSIGNLSSLNATVEESLPKSTKVGRTYSCFTKNTNWIHSEMTPEVRCRHQSR